MLCNHFLLGSVGSVGSITVQNVSVNWPILIWKELKALGACCFVGCWNEYNTLANAQPPGGLIELDFSELSMLTLHSDTIFTF
jgi:hypothetical protein